MCKEEENVMRRSSGRWVVCVCEEEWKMVSVCEEDWKMGSVCEEDE